MKRPINDKINLRNKLSETFPIGGKSKSIVN